MAYSLHSVKTGSNTTFVSLYVPQTREIQAFTFLEIFLQPDHAQHMHSSVNLCFIGSPQSQHLSRLSCIPWSPLKSVLGTTTMWICCAGARVLLWDIPNLTLILHLHRTIPMSLLSSLALHWVKHHGQPRPWGQGESLLCNNIPLEIQTCGKARGMYSSFGSLRSVTMAEEELSPGMQKKHVLVSAPLFHRQHSSPLPSASEEERWSSSPLWCWAVFHSQKRDLCTSQAAQAGPGWDGEPKGKK